MRTTKPLAPPRPRGDLTPTAGHGTVDCALHLLSCTPLADPPLRVELPPAGAIRMRDLVHRGTQRPVFKVPSLKLGRAVQCESILEVEAAVLLDVAPHVSSFAEQAARIHYVLHGQTRSHVPDFAVMLGRRKAFLEIKFEKDLDAEVRERTRHLERGLPRLGWEYHVLTEATLRRGSLLSNANSILRRARHATSDVDSLFTLENLRQRRGATLRDYGWSEYGSSQALSVASLITRGLAAVDWLAPLSDASPVWATDNTNHEEGTSWLLAPSA